MKKLIMFSVVVGLAMAATGCASTSENTASSNDKMETRLKDRDALIQASDQRRLEAAMVHSEMKQPAASQKESSSRP